MFKKKVTQSSGFWISKPFKISALWMKYFQRCQIQQDRFGNQHACHVGIKVLMSGLEFPPERVTYMCIEAQISSWKAKLASYSLYGTQTLQCVARPYIQHLISWNYCDKPVQPVKTSGVLPGFALTAKKIKNKSLSPFSSLTGSDPKPQAIMFRSLQTALYILCCLVTA